MAKSKLTAYLAGQECLNRPIELMVSNEALAVFLTWFFRRGPNWHSSTTARLPVTATASAFKAYHHLLDWIIYWPLLSEVQSSSTYYGTLAPWMLCTKECCQYSHRTQKYSVFNCAEGHRCGYVPLPTTTTTPTTQQQQHHQVHTWILNCFGHHFQDFPSQTMVHKGKKSTPIKGHYSSSKMPFLTPTQWSEGKRTASHVDRKALHLCSCGRWLTFGHGWSGSFR